MPLLVYLDETGDHSLEIVDREFPIFALVMLFAIKPFTRRRSSPLFTG